MKIKNIDDLSTEQLHYEIQNGAKFIVYQYCFSIILMTFKQSTDIYFVKSGESAAKHAIVPTLSTFIFGWWGIPWGPIYTMGSIFTNLTGGKNITKEVLNTFSSE